MNKVQQHYDEIADIYDDRYDGHRGRSYHRHISDHVMSVLPKGGFLLDLGCGTGLFVQRYVEDGGQAVGLDISPGMVRHGRQRCPESGSVSTAESSRSGMGPSMPSQACRLQLRPDPGRCSRVLPGLKARRPDRASAPSRGRSLRASSLSSTRWGEGRLKKVGWETLTSATTQTVRSRVSRGCRVR